MKRTVILLLSLVMLITAAGCANQVSQKTPDTKAGDTAANSGEETLGLPVGVTFDGQNVRFLTVNEAGPNKTSWKTYDIYAEAINGEAVNDAVYKRNKYIEETYNVKIVETQVADIPTVITKSVLAQSDEFEFSDSNMTQSAALSTKGYLYDLASEIPHLDLSKSWWDQEAIAGTSINNKVYFATGDIMAIDNDATFIIMFNKEMINSFSLDNPYDLVSNGKWTDEKMLEMMSAVAGDLNGDGKMVYTDDRYGIADSSISVTSLFYASDLTITNKDENDLPVYSFDVEKTSSFLPIAYKIISDPSVAFNYSDTSKASIDIRNVFAGDRSLFYAECLQCVTRLRQEDITFGILPYPKFSEEQEKYYSYVHGVCPMITVPITNNNLEMTGIILQAMAAKSKELLTPAYYDVTLKGRGLRDEESQPMLDMILSCRRYDLGYVFDWGGYTATLKALVKAGSTDLASKTASLQTVFEKAMDTTLSAYKK